MNKGLSWFVLILLIAGYFFLYGPILSLIIFSFNASKLVTVWGGHQTARTVHFVLADLLTLFVLVHVAMVIYAGFGSRMRAMITGRAGSEKESL